MRRRVKPPVDEVVDLVAEEPVIDLSEPPVQVWGQPGRCPECRGRGYLDSISMARRVMFQHCTECGHAWETSQADLHQPAS